MTTEELMTPLTEIELGELTVAAQTVLTTKGMNLLRRLAFEREQLRNVVKESCSLLENGDVKELDSLMFKTLKNVKL